MEGSLRQCHPGTDASGGDALAAIAIAYLYDTLWGWRLFDIELNLWSLLLLFLLQDLCYWLFHFASHHVRWLWASHVVHHSSERLNLSTAFRQSLMYPVSGMWLFWIPMILIGFPEAVVATVLLSLGFQFFVHTQVVGKLGKLEWIFNTPSHHRVHHASNARYIDRNFAGVLIIWDRLFGTFVEEDLGEPCRFGITKPIHSFNPSPSPSTSGATCCKRPGPPMAAKARRAVWQTGGPHQRLTHRPG